MRAANVRGSAMMIVTIMSFLLAAVAAALMTDVVYRYRQTNASIENDEAMLICRAGLERARRALFLYRSNPGSWDAAFTDGASAWNDILAFNAGKDAVNQDYRYYDMTTVDALTQVQANYGAMKGQAEFAAYRDAPYAPGAGMTPEAPGKADADLLFGQNKPFRSGGYHIVIRDNDDGDADPLADADQTLVCVVTATLDNGTQRQLEALINFETGTLEVSQAVLSGGNIRINGNPTIQGVMGNVHANGDVLIDGAPTIKGELSATGVADPNDKISAGGGELSGAPPVTIPPVKAADFKGYADYIFRSDGKVLEVATGILRTSAWASANIGFVKKPGLWDSTKDALKSGLVLYFETDVKISGNPPKNTYLTMLTEGSLTIAGNPEQMLPQLKVDGYGLINMVADLDLEISGNPQAGAASTFEGLIVAGEQVKLNGNPDISGAVIAQNLQDVAKNVMLGPKLEATQVSGNPLIEYNGGLSIPGSSSNGVTIRNVRRMK